MKLLFVNACPRGEASRTLRLARSFIEQFKASVPEAAIIEHDLCEMAQQPVTDAVLALREPLCDARDWSHPLVQPAKEFVTADAVLIAAPYWDLSFPSVLKIWVEHMYVRNLTFHYEHDRCIGHAQGKRAIYITTAGSPIGDNDWGALYMQAVMKALGIPAFTSLRAEALDLDTSDPEALLRDAEKQVRQAANDLADEFQSLL